MGLEDAVFNLKFISKSMERSSKKATKEEKAYKTKVKKAIEQGNLDGARIYAQNAIRKKSESLNYLRLSSRIDAVASRMETAVKMNAVTKNMTSVTKSMDKVLGTMDVNKIASVMDKFEQQFDNLDVRSEYMENAMAQTTTLSTPEDQVNGLMAEIADEHGLEVGDSIKVSSNLDPLSVQKDDLSERLAKLKKLG